MLTTSPAELVFVNTADHTAVASTASEASLIAGTNRQPFLPAGILLLPSGGGVGKSFQLYAAGVFSTTGTPTMTFQWRLGTTAGSSDLSGSSIGVSGAITTGSGVTNKFWEAVLHCTVTTAGGGAGNTTVRCLGSVWSYGFASPYRYPVEVTTPDTATWTQTFNGNSTYYLNLSLTWSASSASNTATCKELRMIGWNL